MINWFERVDPDIPFLKVGERVWSYGQARSEIGSRLSAEPVVITPELDADGVFDVVAGALGAGAVVVGPGVELSSGIDISGAALVVFTSGSSGRPKGVRLTMDNIEAAATASVEHLGHGSSDTWLLGLPLTHVAGISILLRSAFAGGSVRLLTSKGPQSWIDALRLDVSIVSVVSTVLQGILDANPGRFGGLRAVLVGGGPIPEGLLERAAVAGLPVLPTYGMTETFGQVATLKPGSRLRSEAHLLPGIEIRIESDGRIAIAGRQVSPGYLGEDDRPGHWFLSSDLGELQPDGALRVLGRADTVIVTGGENVDPTRIESELIAEQGVGEAVVVGLPDDRWGHVVMALYTGTATTDDLQRALTGRLPRFMVPTRWMCVGSLPKTDIGKPDRAAALSLAMGDGDR